MTYLPHLGVHNLELMNGKYICRYSTVRAGTGTL